MITWGDDMRDNLMMLDYALTGGNMYLMQYTGLKDKNGVEIYEGDIIKDPSDKFMSTWGEYKQIIHHYGGWKVQSIEAAYHRMSLFTNSDINHVVGCHFHIEIIGNIHENPELLKDK